MEPSKRRRFLEKLQVRNTTKKQELQIKQEKKQKNTRQRRQELLNKQEERYKTMDTCTKK